MLRNGQGVYRLINFSIREGPPKKRKGVYKPTTLPINLTIVIHANYSLINTNYTTGGIYLQYPKLHRRLLPTSISLNNVYRLRDVLSPWNMIAEWPIHYTSKFIDTGQCNRFKTTHPGKTLHAYIKGVYYLTYLQVSLKEYK